MDPEIFVGMISIVTIALTFILTIGGVVLLRPIAKDLGAYLRALTDDRRLPRVSAPAQPVLNALERIEHRLSALEERQEFSEELLRSRHDNPAISPPADGGGSHIPRETSP